MFVKINQNLAHDFEFAELQTTQFAFSDPCIDISSGVTNNAVTSGS